MIWNSVFADDFLKNFDVKQHFFENLLKVRRSTLPSENKEAVPTVTSETKQAVICTCSRCPLTKKKANVSNLRFIR